MRNSPDGPRLPARGHDARAGRQEALITEPGNAPTMAAVLDLDVSSGAVGSYTATVLTSAAGPDVDVTFTVPNALVLPLVQSKAQAYSTRGALLPGAAPGQAVLLLQAIDRDGSVDLVSSIQASTYVVRITLDLARGSGRVDGVTQIGSPGRLVNWWPIDLRPGNADLVVQGCRSTLCDRDVAIWTGLDDGTFGR